MAPDRTCDQCGKPLPPEGRFCAHCGFHSGPPGSGADAEPTTRLGPWERILERLKVVTAGRYDVHRLLGWGGMAGVYLAEELRLKRRVAIKVIAPGLLMDPSQIERFEQEARTTAQLNHPNIVTIYEVDEREDLHYFTMTYVSGRALSQVMAEAAAPLPLGVVEAWVRQVAGALSYAHQRGVVHRDIKPGNILLDEHGNALVGDFGIAKVAEEPGLTRTGMLVGTPAYMSPEQCTTGKVTGASDQYSLGAVAYQMIAGTAPFSGTTIQVIQAHVGETPRDVREWRPDCPDGLAEAVMRMLEKAAEDRWPSLYDAVDALGGTTLRHDDPRRGTMADLAAWTHSVRIRPGSNNVGEDGERSHLEVGESIALEASTLDYRDRELSDRLVEWSVSPEGVAEVDDSGMVRGLGVGKARVRAASGRVAADWVISVGSAATEPLTPAAGIEAALVNPPLPSSVKMPPPGEVPGDPDAMDPPAPLADESEPAAAIPVPGEVDRDADGRVDWIEQVEAAEAAAVEEPVDEETVAGVAARESGADAGVASPPGSYTEVMSAAAAGLPPRDVPPSGDGIEGASLDETPRPVGASRSGRASGPGVAGVLRGLPSWVPAGGGVAVVALLAFALTRGGEEPASPEPAGDDPAAVAAENSSPASATPSRNPVGNATSGDSTSVEDDVAAVDEAEAAAETPSPATRDDPTPATPPASQTTPTQAPATAEPRAPAPGFVRIRGDVPADAMVRVSGPGVDRASRDRTIELAPGRYSVEIRAAGYETLSTELTVPAGGNADWTPTLVPIPSTTDPAGDPPAPAEDEAPDPAAIRSAAISAAVQAFGAALQSRDPARLRQAWPSISSGEAGPWEAFMTSRDVRDLRVDVTISSVPSDGGDRVVVPFLLRLRYENPGAPPPGDPIPYRATVERAGDAWVLVALQAGN